MRTVLTIVVIGWIGCLGGCGGGGSGKKDGGNDLTIQGSCDFRAVQGAGYCQDYAEVPAIAPYMTACSQSGGTWSASACSHANAIGGCASDDNATINWFYQGGAYASAATYQTACEASSGTFKTP